MTAAHCRKTMAVDDYLRFHQLVNVYVPVGYSSRNCIHCRNFIVTQKTRLGTSLIHSFNLGVAGLINIKVDYVIPLIGGIIIRSFCDLDE